MAIHTSCRALLCTQHVNIYIYIYIYIISYVVDNNLLLYIVDVYGYSEQEMSKRNPKARLPYSPGQTAKTALGRTVGRRIINRGPVAQTPVKPVTPGGTAAVDNPSSGSTGADKGETLSTALRAELLELLRSTQNQVAARSSTTTSAHEGFASYEPPRIPTVEDFEGNLKQVMANLPLEAGLNSKSPFVQHTLRFVNSAAAATQELAENICVGISEALTKLGVIHEALGTSLSTAAEGAYRDQVQDLVQATEEVVQHLSDVSEVSLDYQAGLFGHLQSMITGQAAAVRGNSAYLLDGQTYPWPSSSANATTLPSRLAINRNALAATQAALATNLTSEELIRRNPTIAYRYTLVRDQGLKGRENKVVNRDAGEKTQRCYNCREPGHYASNCRYAKSEKSRDRDDRPTSGRHRHKRSPPVPL